MGHTPTFRRLILITFGRRYGSMADSQFLFRSLLVCCFFADSLGGVTSFSLQYGTESLSEASATLICTLDTYTGAIIIIKSEDKTDISPALTTCDDKKCRPRTGYDMTTTGTTVQITIISLQRAEHQKWWACRTLINQNQVSQKQFKLTVYTVPPSIRLNGPNQTCDLGQKRCEYTCTTVQCTYPAPTFTWLYIFDDDTTMVISPTTSISDKAYNCEDESKIYNEALAFPRYKLFKSNTPKTVRLQCYITFTGLASIRRTSNVSKDVIFAVKVSTVQISDGNNQLTENTFTVVNKEEKLLICTPGNGNPTPKTEWFIGSSRESTEAQFKFIPDNSHHGQQIYCVADNIPNNGYDVVSNKPVLYVKVKIRFVYIEPAADTLISVIENTPGPVVCTTSAGRPGSTIKWYRNNVELNDGDNTNFERADNNLNVTKSTRNIKVLRSDAGWTLTCSASNFEGSSPLWANNSKEVTVLYPPEHMNLSFSGKPVVGHVVDVIKGTPGNLKCSASSNPPVDSFSWNINQKDGDTLIIDDNIENGQIVNCTARNIMTPTDGKTKYGYGSISKQINIQYGAFINGIEVNGITESPWVIKENDSMFIACYVDSNPDSTISLFQGHNHLTEKEQSTVLFHNISSAQCSDAGQYICKAKNGITNVEQPASMTVLINVECSPRLAADAERSVFAQENTSAVLSLTLLAYPIPTKYDWHRNTSNTWEKLENSSSIRMTKASLQFNLTFTSVTPDDYGEYKLIVYDTNNIPFNFTVALKAKGGPDPHALQPDDGSTATAGTIGGVVGGLLVVCLIIIVICFLRRRNSFDDIKSKLFGKTSAASSEETKLGGESIPASGYLYPEDNPVTLMQDNKALETTNEGPCYENPAVVIKSDAKAKPQKKGKSAKQKDKKQISQSHDGLQYVELSFSDTKKKCKKTKPVQPKADERTVYDAVQFGVVGAAYTSNGEENDTKK